MNRIYSKLEVIQELATGEYLDVQDIIIHEFPLLEKEEFNEMALQAGYFSIGNYFVLH